MKTPRANPSHLFFGRCVAFAILLLLPLGLCATERTELSGKWINTWVSAQQLTEPHNLPPAPGLSGQTIRQIIQPTLAGNRLRVSFSNGYGEAPLTIASAHVARSIGADAIEPGSDTALKFNGSSSVVIQPGTFIISDDVAFPVTPFENLSVSTYISSMPTHVTGHPGSRTTSFIQPGDVVSAPGLPTAVAVDHWYVLSSIEVWGSPTSAAIVVIGDSITDGRGSTTNQNDRWPNLLARRLNAQPATAQIAVLNQGAGGGRVLRDGLGTSALGRFDRDVVAVPGVKWLVVFAGVNDIGTAVGARAKGEVMATANDLIAAFRQMILRAHRHGIRVIGATIMPFGGFASYDTPESEADRQVVNTWIRTSGEFDGVIDFDAITRDESSPSKLSPAVDGGDHLHPSAKGYEIMAGAIDLSIFAD
ncbi:MAG TPA: SGNH/GDSL hydrolase family protein [Opitutus sp.]|nr:SGNH/GDSL hydrolase family protein [Opitutus sp.]